MGNRKERRKKLKYYLEHNKHFEDSPDKCFICHGENNIQFSNLCCGRTYYHQICFDEFCEKSGMKCPICHTDVSHKINIQKKKCFNVMKLFHVITYFICFMLYYHIINQSMDIHKGIYCQYNRDKCENLQVLNYDTKLEWVKFFIAPFILSSGILITFRGYYQLNEMIVAIVFSENCLKVSMGAIAIFPFSMYVGGTISNYLLNGHPPNDLIIFGVTYYNIVSRILVGISWFGIIINALVTIVYTIMNIFAFFAYGNTNAATRIVFSIIKKAHVEIDNTFYTTNDNYLINT